MSANVYVFKRDKANGYYQNDMRCECIGEFNGWATYDYVMGEVVFNFNAEGTVVLTSCEDMGRILSTMAEYETCYMENRRDFSKNYQFYYRVEKTFFDALMSREHYKEWSQDNDWPGEKKWVREQLAKFRKVIPTLDFEQNYYYVVESI